MAVSTRELMLVLRARDESARMLRNAAGNIKHMDDASREAAQAHMQQGQALLTMGAGVAAAGAIGVVWMNEATKAATKYNQASALTLTQTDDLGASLEQIKDIGLRVAKTIPVPFEQIQEGLYDIFSSMDVSVPEAEMLLTEFSKAAVAGQTDLQTAARGSIAIMNAWKLPATDVNRVNDVMFRLVQKGVGTYGEFSKAIGRAIPSTVRAGNSIEDLAGMMAFMTRNGLSTAQAATSAGRAFDAMSHPASIERMEKMGITVRNAKGEFLPMSTVVESMNEKLGHLTAPARAKAMRELFLGSGGTIQARRFFDLAVPGFEELNQLTSDMTNSSGTMKGAYDIMFAQPQSQIQLMTNKYEAMRTEVGDKLLPIKMKLVEGVMALLDAWNGLSEGTQKNIVIIAVIITVLTILTGIVMVVVGGILMMMGAAALAGVALGTVVGIIAGVVAAIVALVVAVVMIWRHWDDIKEWTSKTWKSIKTNISDATTNIKDTIKRWIESVKQSFITLGRDVVAFVKRDFNNMIAFFQGIPGRVRNAISTVASVTKAVFTTAMNGVKTTVREKFSDVVRFFREIPGRIRNAIPAPAQILFGIGKSIIQGLISGVQNMIGSLQNQFSRITNMIPDWKGPASVDKKLLYNAGKLTMQGYSEGIDYELPALWRKLKGVTQKIPLTQPRRPVVLGSRMPAPAGGDSASGTTQNFYITTQEIEPRKHSADLGMMVASRLG